jgi:hypothetical protein
MSEAENHCEQYRVDSAGSAKQFAAVLNKNGA